MAPLARSALLPQCSSCLRQLTRLGLDAWKPLEQQPVRHLSKAAKSKAAKEAEHNIVVKLLKDVKKFGRKGSYIPIAPAMMRNRWLPMRLADYVPKAEVDKLKADNVPIQRDFEFGVVRPLVEVDAPKEDFEQTHYVRPVEIELLTPERSMELLNTFVPPTIDFFRQPKEQDESAQQRLGAFGATDVLSAVGSKKEVGIYGSVSVGDVAATIRDALAHNDEAARVILSDRDVHFLDGHVEGDTTRIKQLGTFKVEVKVEGATEPMIRTVRIRATGPK